MPDTPLNPDALVMGAKAIIELQKEASPWKAGFDDMSEGTQALLTAEFAVGMKAYLAVAQPEVNNVEELDALPIGSAFVDVDGDTMVVTVPVASDWGTGEFRMEKFFGSDGIYYSAEDLIHSLPARVLYRPEVKA